MMFGRAVAGYGFSSAQSSSRQLAVVSHKLNSS